MRLPVIIGLAMLGVSACNIGKNAADWPVAKQPLGAMVTLKSDSATFTGELIEVTEEGVVVRDRSGKLVFARFTIIEHLAATGLGSAYRFGNRQPPEKAAKANLVMVSHFPQGMTPEIRQRMLAMTGQAEIEILR